MKKKPKPTVRPAPRLTSRESEREDMRRALARQVKRERTIRALTRQLTVELTKSDHGLKVLAVKVLFPEGVASKDAGERNLVAGTHE